MDGEKTPERKWVTILEGAEITGRPASTIATAVKRHRILAVKSGVTWLVYLPALMDYLEYAEQVRAAGNIGAAKRIGGPFSFLGHGRKVRYNRNILYDPQWWENLQEWEIITETPGE